MPLLTRYSADALGWQRKPGPVKVWRVVDGKKKTVEGKILRFSIQEIPEDRYEEVLEVFPIIMAHEEPLCENLGVYKDPEAIAEIRKIWSFCLQQGIVMGAFLVDENNPKPILAGVNATWVLSESSAKGRKHEIQLKSPAMQVMSNLRREFDTEVNVRELYKVDKYFAAFGLCVNPPYRGQGLAYHLLKARDDMSAEYGIHATATVFTALASQKAAAAAGFEILTQRNFIDIRNEEGNQILPGIQQVCKFMGKRFS